MRGFPGQCKVFRDTWYLINAVCGLGECIKIMFKCQTSSWTVLVLWCVQMYSLSLVVTSEIKYIVYRKVLLQWRWKTWYLTSFHFYLIIIRQQCFKRIQFHGKSTYISNNILINIKYFSSRFTVQNRNGSAPNKHAPS